MSSCQCQGIEKEFNEKYVKKAVKGYHKKGAAKSTLLLITMIKELGVKDRTLLDIGGGVGAIQIEFLKEGLKSAIAVDASEAYLLAARKESESQGFKDRVQYQQGDYVDLAENIEKTHIVTLDKVLCCYDKMEELVKLSVKKAKQFYGLIYPRDSWWAKTAFTFFNFALWISRNTFRVFFHDSDRINALIKEAGLNKQSHTNSGMWQVVIYKY